MKKIWRFHRLSEKYAAIWNVWIAHSSSLCRYFWQNIAQVFYRHWQRKSGYFKTWTRLRGTQRSTWYRLWKWPLQILLKSKRDVGISAWGPKGDVLNATKARLTPPPIDATVSLLLNNCVIFWHIHTFNLKRRTFRPCSSLSNSFLWKSDVTFPFKLDSWSLKHF